MFRLRVEIDIPTEEHAEAQLVQEHIKAMVERGLGFNCYMQLHNMGVDHRHTPMGFSVGNLDGADLTSHSHSFAIDAATLRDENGNWFHPAHVVQPIPKFTEEEKRNFLKKLLPETEPEFIKEKDMTI